MYIKLFEEFIKQQRIICIINKKKYIFDSFNSFKLFFVKKYTPNYKDLNECEIYLNYYHYTFLTTQNKTVIELELEIYYELNKLPINFEKADTTNSYYFIDLNKNIEIRVSDHDRFYIPKTEKFYDFNYSKQNIKDIVLQIKKIIQDVY